MKKIFILFLLLLQGSSVLGIASMQDTITFEQKAIIKALDGFPGGIDAEAIRNSSSVKKNTITIQYGQLNEETGIRIGNYTFLGKAIGVHGLAKIENELSIKLKKKYPALEFKKLYNGNHTIPTEFAKEFKELQNCFKQAKSDFKKATFALIPTIRDAKHFVVKLMEESCKKRGVQQSPMLKWADVNGNEDAMFNVSITTLTEFDLFLTHLNIFLRDLMFNCPRAYQQFLLEEKKRRRDR